ncbi:MAG: hypothetical protein KGI26_00110 [Thaumarchaeota archaeon]|nr:hypothetical protein [Nitrososphaerota archaeon]
MSEIRAKTRHGEMTIDQLAEIQPGMAALMKEAGDRFTHTYYAAKGGNWKLAAHHLNQLRASFRTAKTTRPKFAEDLDAYDKEYLLPIFESIRDQDWSRFEAAFRKGEDGSDVYHDKRGYPHIRYLLPKDPPSNLYLGPPEEFKRGSRAAEKTP